LPSLEALTTPGLIFPDLEAKDAPGVLRELAARLAERGAIRDPEGLFQRLWEREQLGSTAIGGGVAIPHCKLDHIDRVLVAVAVARDGVAFGAADGAPVGLFFLVVSPSRSPAEHLQSLAAISKWVKTSGGVGRLIGASDAEAIYRTIRGDDV
jgi:PTS system nitrogen regulatory IIA component